MPNNFSLAANPGRLPAWPNPPKDAVGNSADAQKKNETAQAAPQKNEKNFRIHRWEPITLSLAEEDFDPEKSLRSQFPLNLDMRHLQTLRIELVGIHLRMSHHVELASLLRQCADLRELQIRIPASSRELKETFIALETLKHLKHLTLDVPNAGSDQNKENIFSSLGKSMRHLSELEHLDINMNEHGCTNNELTNLLFHATRLGKLKSFSLDITQGSALTSEAASDALKSIGKLENLEVLRLKIDANTNIDKRKLLSTLNSLKNLKEFEINVSPPWLRVDTINSIGELEKIIAELYQKTS